MRKSEPKCSFDEGGPWMTFLSNLEVCETFSFTEDQPEPEEDNARYLECARELPNRARVMLATDALPGWLEKTVGISPSLTIGMVESIKLGSLCLRENNLDVSLTVRHLSILRACDSKGAFCFSMEPTGTEGRWLVFMCF